MTPETSYARFCSGPTSEEIARHTPDCGDHLSAAMSELARDPTEDRCDRVVAALDGARQLVFHLRTALAREASAVGHGE